MKRIFSAIGRLAQILPNQCVLCGLKCPAPRPVCMKCFADLPWLISACPQCRLPLPAGEDQNPCGQCQSHPPPFDHCYAPFAYAAPVDFLIRGFKDRAQWRHLTLLAEALGECLLHSYGDEPWPDYLLPVPLHWRRRLWRGFNQTEVLGHALLTHLRQTAQLRSQSDNTPPDRLLYRALLRTRATQHQRGGSRAHRKHNLSDAFRLNPTAKALFQGAHVAILDDVVTTGSTANETSRLLCRAGASRIDIWALARTPLLHERGLDYNSR